MPAKDFTWDIILCLHTAWNLRRILPKSRGSEEDFVVYSLDKSIQDGLGQDVEYRGDTFALEIVDVNEIFWNAGHEHDGHTGLFLEPFGDLGNEV